MKTPMAITMLLILSTILFGCSNVMDQTKGDQQQIEETDETQHQFQNTPIVKDDYTLVIGDHTISLKSWDTEVDLSEVFGQPKTEKLDVLGEGADTFSGSYLKTLEYDGLTITLFSPKDNGKQFWIMSIDLQNSNLKTLKGITVGSSLSDLKDAYQNIEMVLDGRTDSNNAAYLISDKEEYKQMTFEVENGVVKAIKLNVELP